MLLTIYAFLDVENDQDDATLWAALIFAFHFMCRSNEYCAKISGGKFALDKVILMCNVRFYKNGVRLLSNFASADEMRGTLGLTKKAGGETRSVFAVGGPLCAVQAMARIMEQNPNIDAQVPAFSWPSGSSHAGEGVRYYDIMKAVKMAAVKLGVDPSDYASHSIRRGAASHYLAAQMPYEWVRIQGRWRSDCVREYLDMIGQETKVYTLRIAQGDGLHLTETDPSTQFQLQRPERSAQVWADATRAFQLRQLQLRRTRVQAARRR